MSVSIVKVLIVVSHSNDQLKHKFKVKKEPSALNAAQWFLDNRYGYHGVYVFSGIK